MNFFDSQKSGMQVSHHCAAALGAEIESEICLDWTDFRHKMRRWLNSLHTALW